MPTLMLDRPSHDQDFHAWALDHAQRLRALARKIYEVARAEALAAPGGDPDFDDRAPDRCPHSWEQIIGDWLPDRQFKE